MNSPTRSFRWRRLLLVLATLAVLGYLGAATALWAYYRFHRGIAAVQWHDIAVFPRFGRVQRAIGAQYLVRARASWEARDYVQGLFLARSALAKDPAAPQTREFLASCWREVGRPAFACRVLEEGLANDSAEQPLAHLLVELYVETGRPADLLALLRTRLPALGRRPPESQVEFYQLAELRAVYQTEGAAAADALLLRWPHLQQRPEFSPLLARIDVALGDPGRALERLRAARENAPENPAVHNALFEIARDAGLLSEARAAAERFVTAFPSLPLAELRLLEINGSRTAEARGPWLVSCMRYLDRFHDEPAALTQLADLAARRGWADLAFLLYENAISTGHEARPFALNYVCSLVAQKNYEQAGRVWTDLVAQQAVNAETSPALAAMIAAGAGRQGDALEQVERLRTATVDDQPRRHRLALLFRDFGFAALAEALIPREA